MRVASIDYELCVYVKSAVDDVQASHNLSPMGNIQLSPSDLYFSESQHVRMR